MLALGFCNADSLSLLLEEMQILVEDYSTTRTSVSAQALEVNSLGAIVSSSFHTSFTFDMGHNMPPACMQLQRASVAVTSCGHAVNVPLRLPACYVIFTAGCVLVSLRSL